MTPEKAKAYQDGKIAYHYRNKSGAPNDPELLFEFRMGWKHAASEDRLDQDTEWDD